VRYLEIDRERLIRHLSRLLAGATTCPAPLLPGTPG
jgi:hypothetical protein